jgi:hypothetical protein
MMLAIDFRVVPKAQLRAELKVDRGALGVRQSEAWQVRWVAPRAPVPAVVLLARGGGSRKQERGIFCALSGHLSDLSYSLPPVYFAYLSYAASTCGIRAILEEPPEA